MRVGLEYDSLYLCFHVCSQTPIVDSIPPTLANLIAVANASDVLLMPYVYPILGFSNSPLAPTWRFPPRGYADLSNQDFQVRACVCVCVCVVVVVVVEVVVVVVVVRVRVRVRMRVRVRVRVLVVCACCVCLLWMCVCVLAV